MIESYPNTATTLVKAANRCRFPAPDNGRFQIFCKTLEIPSATAPTTAVAIGHAGTPAPAPQTTEGQQRTATGTAGRAQPRCGWKSGKPGRAGDGAGSALILPVSSRPFPAPPKIAVSHARSAPDRPAHSLLDLHRLVGNRELLRLAGVRPRPHQPSPHGASAALRLPGVRGES